MPLSVFLHFKSIFGQSPHLIPPIVPTSINELTLKAATDIITQIYVDVNKAKDNLFQAKVFQAHFMNGHQAAEDIYSNGDHVMLSTLHRHQEYKKGKKCVTKFFPHFDGPYEVINTHPSTSTYTLDLPNSPNIFPTFHTSKLKQYIPNDPALFPSRELPHPGPILTTNSLEEYFMQEIIDTHRQGCGWQYLV